MREAANKGKIRSPEQRARLSEIIKGRPLSPERRAAMRANPPTKGKKWTEEQKRTLSEAQKKLWTPERRAKHSLAQRESRAKNPRPGHPIGEAHRFRLGDLAKKRAVERRIMKEILVDKLLLVQ